MVRWAGAPQLIATVLRDVATPTLGLCLAAWEVLHGGDTNWGRIVLIGGMIGLPTFTFLDWRQASAPPTPPALPTGSTSTAE